MKFNIWLNTFLSEKQINRDYVFEIPCSIWGIQIIPLEVVIEFINGAPEFQQQVKSTLIMIDFKNADVMHYFEHLATGLAKTQAA